MQKRKFSPNPNIALRAVDSKKRKAHRIRKRLSTFLSAREPKYMETGLAVTSLTSTPQVFALSDIAQGQLHPEKWKFGAIEIFAVRILLQSGSWNTTYQLQNGLGVGSPT